MKPKKIPNDFVPVASFNHRADAERLRALLVAEGMPAQLQDERTVQKFGFFVAPKAGVHVQVPARFFEATRKILTNHQSNECVRNAIHCPSCDSMRVQYPAMTRKNILPAIVTRLLVLLGITEHKYYCEDCHFTWSPPQPDGAGPRPPETAPAR